MTHTPLRTKLAARRQVRAAQQDLLRELAPYRTSREVLDLLAALQGRDGGEVELMRTALTRKLNHTGLRSVA